MGLNGQLMSLEAIKGHIELARELGLTSMKVNGLEIQLNPLWVTPGKTEDTGFVSGKVEEPVIPKHLQSMPSDDKMLLWSTDEDLEDNPNEQPRMGDEP